MNTRIIKWMVTGLITSLIVLSYRSITVKADQPIEAIDPAIASHILNSTVQIRLYTPIEEAGISDGQAIYVMSQGLGSLVEWQGTSVIVSHNHWGEMMNGAEYAQILDANGNLVCKLGLEELKNLILYSDPGTLVLAATAGLSATSTISDQSESMAVDDVVTLVHQDPENPDRLDLLQARVVNLKDYKGQPVYKLALIDDGQIVPGDSGGGIWSKDVLVGNMWASYINTIKLAFSAETSLAAPLPSIHLAMGDISGAVSLLQSSIDGPSELPTAK